MPASSLNLYHMQDAKNNFQALRPAPVCNHSNMLMGQCHNIHISTNCYYGFHDQKNGNSSTDVDCEMVEVSHGEDIKATSSPQSNARKRSAEDCSYPKNKRLREEVQIMKSLERETIEKCKLKSDTTVKKTLETISEDSLELFYWKLHGGNFYHVLQCL